MNVKNKKYLLKKKVRSRLSNNIPLVIHLDRESLISRFSIENDGRGTTRTIEYSMANMANLYKRMESGK